MFLRAVRSRRPRIELLEAAGAWLLQLLLAQLLRALPTGGADEKVYQ